MASRTATLIRSSGDLMLPLDRLPAGAWTAHVRETAQQDDRSDVHSLLLMFSRPLALRILE
jgi:hypothetical protein